MPIGPGKYDDLCTVAREQAKADGVILMVINGLHGFGFSVQVELEMVSLLPKMLRDMAKDIEDTLARGSI